MNSQLNLKLTRAAAVAVVFACAGLVVTPLTGSSAFGFVQSVEARAILFYGITSAAYCSLPFVRRGDIALVAMWLMLLVGIAPLFNGEELNAKLMFADMAGVLLAAAPIYIARLRQILQGDVRADGRRAEDTVEEQVVQF